MCEEDEYSKSYGHGDDDEPEEDHELLPDPLLLPDYGNERLEVSNG